MQVEQLRLAGFKSFVEPTELAIGPGLTGIVGPNGCGKSNLVEALRWVMGEGSARRLRGDEMDDVIFAGSAGRPARNLAEVVLTLKNARDQAGLVAPLAFSDSPTIEVTRRIARGVGSSYRVNGREARARDVQLLFADGASGAHSAALVGQGRIGALIAAKPAERRLLLDEAAGTAGLHARRHEAELKLGAAEDNLARLADIAATLAAQIDALKKQARQAARYRRLGEQIRAVETQLLEARWRVAAAAAAAAGEALRACERDLAGALAAALAAARDLAAAEAGLPALRLAQAAAAAAVQRIAHAGASLAEELQRVTAAQGEADRRHRQLDADVLRAAEHLADADAALRRLRDERDLLERAAATADRDQRSAAATAAAAAAGLVAAEAGLQQMAEACAGGEARREALLRQCREVAERRTRLAARLADSERQRQPLLAALAPADALAAVAAAVTTAAAQIDGLQQAVAAASEELLRCRQRETIAAERARDGERLLAGLRAEEAALAKLVMPAAPTASEAAPLLSQVQVAPGFEAAVAALFDGELAAPLLPLYEAGAAAAGWIALAPLPPAAPPPGARPLAAALAAPAALARRLARSFWVDGEADGWRLQPLLAPGQSLVDRDGRLWRWDGYTRANGASGATAEKLRHQNRLQLLKDEIAAAAATARRGEADVAAAGAVREAASTAERTAVAALRAADERLAKARAAEAELSRRHLAAETRLAALDDSIARLAADLAELQAQSAAADSALARLPDADLARTALMAARAETALARRRDAEARAPVDRLATETAARRHRLAAIAEEAAAWQRRRDAAAAQRATLAERQQALAAEIAALAARPAAIAEESATLSASALAAAAAQRAAEDALAHGEAQRRQGVEAARAGEAAVAALRERRARLQAQHEAAAAALAQLRRDIAEQGGRLPEAEATAASGDAAAAPGGDGAIGELDTRLDRLQRERAAIGPVNLLAEREMAQASARLDTLQRERGDLSEAIVRLRRGIATLDREGRERLRAAFDALNRHFAELFCRLFGGGEAQLAWTGGDDPLQAGLDIAARPPGKRLQTLSLLSGGEQALTAIALIFAVFLTKPAPVCVLDEVDAPLDDANVDGFCRLVAEIADSTRTRFLVITHHRVTMARMDRLFGVTMIERGVSQLVSVDLARAAELRQSA